MKMAILKLITCQQNYSGTLTLQEFTKFLKKFIVTDAHMIQKLLKHINYKHTP